jgi:hypothetical protein
MASGAPMKLETVEIRSIASGRDGDNEDRAGVAAPLAWVIDGATDVNPEPLTGRHSDAAWFAESMHELITGLPWHTPASLQDLPELVAGELAQRFALDAKRKPAGRDEHPSASAIVVRLREDGLEYVSVGDCALIVENDGQPMFVGVDEEDAGDRWVVDALRGQSADGKPTAKPLTRADLWPRLRQQRAKMNTAEGYGVFSITTPPPLMIRHGVIEAKHRSRVLLATDGLMRLVDVFRTHTTETLLETAWTTGLKRLFDELRSLETADQECTRYPRAKTSDDTSAVLLRITD